MADRIGRDRESGAGLLLWLADRVIEGKAEVMIADRQLRPFKKATIEVGLYVDVVRDLEEEVYAVKASTLDDARHLEAMSLTARLTHAERMATKWSARFEDIHRTVNGLPFGPADPYTKKRARLVELAKGLIGAHRKGGGFSSPVDPAELARLVVELFG